MEVSTSFFSRETQTKIAHSCVQIIDERIAAKPYFSSLALQIAYQTIKSSGPDFILSVLKEMLPRALEAIDPIWIDGWNTGDPVRYISQKRSQAADILLQVTDNTVSHLDNVVVRAAYQHMRPSLKDDVEEAIPALAIMLYKNAYV